MKVITEVLLRSEFRAKIPKHYIVEEGSITTPSARQFLREKNVEIVIESGNCSSGKNKRVENEYDKLEEIKGDFKPKFISTYDGGMHEKKPEFMTHVYGNKLVFKDDQRIVFRGKVDSLQAKFLRAQHNILKENEKMLSAELEDVLSLLRNILRAEVLEEELGEASLFGLTLEELQKHSHDPKKHYGISHFLPSITMGLPMIELNELRTSVREVEIIAMKAFRNGLEIRRKDIIYTLNRMSSAIYVLMCRYNSKYYENVVR